MFKRWQSFSLVSIVLILTANFPVRIDKKVVDFEYFFLPVVFAIKLQLSKISVNTSKDH